MKAFATLLDRLSFAHSRLRKLELMREYFKETPDPERGYAFSALTGTLDFPEVKSSSLKSLVAGRVDPVLFTMSYHYVGDLADTVALIWPGKSGESLPPLTEVAETLIHTPKGKVGEVISPWLDAGSEAERWTLIKLVTGDLRVGVSERLARQALAELFAKPVEEIEEVWHALAPPYVELFRWLEGKDKKPDLHSALTFRPLMLSHPIEDAATAGITPEEFAAEWKWDGIRVQLVGDGASLRMFSRTGDDISGAFPDYVAGQKIHAVLDGELLIVRGGEVQSFNALQQRLNRKNPSAKMMHDSPAHVRLYDILFDGEEDVRGLSFDWRRARLEAWVAAHHPRHTDISPLVAFNDWHELAEIQKAVRISSPSSLAEWRDISLGGGNNVVEGFMLKRRASPYIAGRPKGHWYKWKRDPHTVDVVMMYAQRGHGKRSSYYSDFTFGAWAEIGGKPVLVPVGKAYSGYTDEELLVLDRWIRNHTVSRFGPVREVKQELVLEIAFDDIQASNRHKSGVAMRFPRINRIRWDKPAAEADTLDNLKALIHA